jgi:hypothetical protein
MGRCRRTIRRSSNIRCAPGSWSVLGRRWASDPEDAPLHDGDRPDEIAQVVMLHQLVDGDDDGVTGAVGGADHDDAGMRSLRVAAHITEPAVEGQKETAFVSSGRQHARILRALELLVGHGVDVMAKTREPRL